MLLNERHAVHTLVQQELHRKKSLIHPNIGDAKIRAAIAIAGIGLEHHSGEQAMAFQGDAEWDMFTLVTDRRAFGACGQARYEVRFSAMAGVEVENTFLDRRVVVQRLEGEPVYIINVDFMQPLGAFLQAVGQLSPQDREPAPRPLCAPSEADPTGAGRALGWLGEVDERSAQLLRFVAVSCGKGEMPVDVARDSVRRIVLMHRNVHFGRGMAEGRWLSPVSANDLSNAMVHLYGNPLSHTDQPVRTLEFQSGLQSDYGKAAVSSAIGLASAAVLGFGWSTSARRRLQRFRFMVADTPASASFRLQAPNGKGLEHDEPQLQNEVDVKLLPLEDAVLLRRVLRGWQSTTMDLLAIGEEELSDELGRTLRSAPELIPLPGQGDANVDIVRDGSRANVYAMVNDAPGQAMSTADAKSLMTQAQAALSADDDVSAHMNAAAQLMMARAYEEAAAAFRGIAEAHPEERAVCYSQVGAACYFAGLYDEAIGWYEAALREGADPAMMKDNIDEARQALEASQ